MSDMSAICVRTVSGKNRMANVEFRVHILFGKAKISKSNSEINEKTEEVKDLFRVADLSKMAYTESVLLIGMKTFNRVRLYMTLFKEASVSFM